MDNVGKNEYKVELDPVYKAKLEVLVETAKLKAPHAPITRDDVVNKALAQGLDTMLRQTLGLGDGPWLPSGNVIGTVPRAGMVDVLSPE